MLHRDYELRRIGETVVFNGEEYTIDCYGESIDYFVVDESGRGLYLNEWQLPNNRCPDEYEGEE